MLPARARTQPLVPVVPMRLPVAPVAPKTIHNAAEAMVAVVVEVAAEVAKQDGHAPKRGQELEPEMEVSV